MPQGYSEVQKAQAMILLAANKGNVDLTASVSGISRTTIGRWAREEKTNPDRDIGIAMEEGIHYIMAQIPSLVNKYNVADLLDTLLDKWLIYQGIPQNNVQTIVNVLATKSDLELDDILHSLGSGDNLQLEAGKGEVIDIPAKEVTSDHSVLDLIEYTGKASDDPSESISETEDW